MLIDFQVESLVEEALKCKTTESMKSFIVRMLEACQPNAVNHSAQQHGLNDLSNLYQLQKKLEETSSGRQQKAFGFHIIKTEITTNSLAGFVFTCGQLIRQRVIRKNGMNLIESETRQLTNQEALRIPQEINEGIRENDTDPEKAIESHLFESAQVNHFRDYVNLTGHGDDIREGLRLPKHGFHAGNRLMRWKKHLSGVQSEYLYCSSSRDGGTAAEMHREDGDLHSANILYAGKPKLWVFISPCSRNALEYNLQKRFGITAICSQFVRHLHCLPSPFQLREWGILYSIRRQYPGDLILVLPDVYHYVINEGINLAGAINYAEPDWQLNHLYTDCTERCSGNSSIPMKRLAGSLASEPRPLDLEEDFEIPQAKRSNSNSLNRNPRQKRSYQSDKLSRRPVNWDNRSDRYQLSTHHGEVESEGQRDIESSSVSTSDDTATVPLSSTSSSSSESTSQAPNEIEQEASYTTPDKTNKASSCLQLVQDSQMNDQSQHSSQEATMSDPRHRPSDRSCEESISSSSNKEARLNSARPAPSSELLTDTIGNDVGISSEQLQNLEILQWDQIFHDFRRETEYSTGTIYRLMALASLPGNVNVLERLQSVLSEAQRHASLHTEPISTFSTLWSRYTLALGKSAFWKLQQVLSEIQIVYDYRQRESRLCLEKEAQNDGKSHQIQEIDRTNKRIATLVLDEIQEENGSKGDDKFRKKYNQAKRNGLAILSLKDLFGIPEDNISGLVLLLPTEPTSSSLDDGIEADVNTYVFIASDFTVLTMGQFL